MKKLIVAFTILAFLSDKAYAEEKTITLQGVAVPSVNEDVGTTISPMNKGQKAPFSGVLLSPLAVATVIADQNAAKEKIKIEIKKEHDTQVEICRKEKTDIQISSDADKKIFQLDSEEKTKSLKALEEQLKKEIENRPNRVFWTGVGMVGGAAVSILTTYVIMQSTK